MKSFISAVVVAIAMAVGAAVVLEGYQQPADSAYKTQGVRY
ncbi:hypothetical protein [Prosthecomicrobium sp. N25]